MKIVTAVLVVAILAITSALIAQRASHPSIAGVSTPITARAAAPAQAVSLVSNSQLKREVMGFVDDFNLGDPNVGYRSWHFDLLGSVVYFALHVNSGDGSLVKTDTGWNVYHSPTFTSFVQAAHSAGTKVLVSVNLHADLCNGLSPTNAQNTIGEIVGQMKGMGIEGININYEGNLIQCTPTDTTRSLLVSFTKNMRAAMPTGSYLAIDTYAGSAEDNLEFFDIASLQPYVDTFMVMSYDSDQSNWSEVPLNCPSYCFNPVSPLNTYRFNVTKSMTQYLNYAPSSKIILGQPYYGRRGCVADNVANAHQVVTRDLVSPTYLIAINARNEPHVYNFVSHRDPSEGAAEWDTYSDPDAGCTKEQYFDDSVSLSYKYDAVNNYNLRGVGLFTLDYAGGATELWNALATHFTTIPGLPGNLNACTGSASVSISWTAAPTAGGPITGYKVTASPGGASLSVPANATFATMAGLTPGTSYTFTVQGINSSGAGVGAVTGGLTPGSAPPLFTTYLNWYDKASPGVINDNVHLVNPGTTTSSGCVVVSGLAVRAWSADPGQETYVTMPAGTIGGPVVVTVNSGPAVPASQRVQFNNSFNELWATGVAASTSFFNWFDKASPGMVNDNIHVLNPGTSSANVIVSVPGAVQQNVTVAAGAEAYVTFPAGTIGGPVMVSSTQPVLASQRVQYNSTFNEVWAASAAQAATTSYLNWYDKASPGMTNDNIHLFNPGNTSATVTVNLPGATRTATVAPGMESYVNFAGSIGGPVKVSSSQPVVASQRVQYNDSFNEVWAASTAQSMTSYFNWYDRASAGMSNDNIHVLNPGTTTANVTVSVPGATPQTVTVGAGAEVYVNFPATIGGPAMVTVNSGPAVLASQRVQYYSSFNEIWSSG